MGVAGGVLGLELSNMLQAEAKNGKLRSINNRKAFLNIGLFPP